MSAPVRVQLRRMRGWRMPPNTVKVDRSTAFGNPHVLLDGVPREVALRFAVEAFRRWIDDPRPDYAASRRILLLSRLHQLRGRNLACWCRPGEPCHADVLLELANR